MNLKKVKFFPRHDMLDIVKVDGHAKGIITRNLVTGEIKSFSGDSVILATGGYGNVFYLSTNAMASNVTASWRAHKKVLILLIHVLHKFILHVFLLIVIINQN